MPLEDVGPAGVDKGKGGKYLVLPPYHPAAVSDGYIALPSMNYQGYALLRSILKSGSDADIASSELAGIAEMRRARVMWSSSRLLKRQLSLPQRYRSDGLAGRAAPSSSWHR